MSGYGQRADEKQSAEIYESGEQKGVGAPRGVAAKKIAGAPARTAASPYAAVAKWGVAAMFDEGNMGSRRMFRLEHCD